MKLLHFFAVILLALSASARASYISFQASTDHIVVGDAFYVDVILEKPFDGLFEGDELLAFGFNLGYDAGVLQLIDSTMGAPWDDDSALFPGIDVAGSAFPGVTDDSGAGLLLARLSFSAVAAGLSQLSLFGDSAANPDLGLLYVSGSDVIDARKDMRIYSVPQPASMWMLALGGLGLLVRRKAAGVR
ncbi:hypothetical protein HCH_06681 [Hahella chejuensis KCTC 2396]|uniref:Ice-binding protein C-terminal domain-containing protein n=1 Tax=Hahella chejuensis (strain KCTC 2396) TaxID=349521 RepID=Q2S7R3_HAHCH|nr:cohesin domain-containing protein [Hahella chejuensis]ABC33311.1 hypothetical protein HCH_06681 [Hahella chejuensis KCTC 2396]